MPSDSLIINQYQSFFKIGGGKGVLIDFLRGTLELIERGNDQQVIEEYSEGDMLKEIGFAKRLMCTKSTLTTIVLIPSYKCNLRCEYCYQGRISKYNNRRTCISAESICRYVKHIGELEGTRKLHLCMMGGEPLLSNSMDFFVEFFKLADLNGVFDQYEKVDVSCTTNGTTIGEFLSSLKELPINEFQVTLDGDEEAHNRRRVLPEGNCFQRCVEGIDLLLANQYDVIVRVNIDETNIESIPRLCDFINGKGWKENDSFRAYLYPLSESGCVAKEYLPEIEVLERTLDVLEKIPVYKRCFSLNFHGLKFIDALLENRLPRIQDKFCSAEYGQYVFDPTGSIYACWDSIGISEMKVGEYDEFDMELFKDKIDLVKMRDAHHIEKCISCKFKYICGGGCAYKVLSQGGTLFDPRCADYDRLIGTYLKFVYNSKEAQYVRD